MLMRIIVRGGPYPKASSSRGTLFRTPLNAIGAGCSWAVCGCSPFPACSTPISPRTPLDAVSTRTLHVESRGDTVSDSPVSPPATAPCQGHRKYIHPLGHITARPLSLSEGPVSSAVGRRLGFHPTLSRNWWEKGQGRGNCTEAWLSCCMFPKHAPGSCGAQGLKWNRTGWARGWGCTAEGPASPLLMTPLCFELPCDALGASTLGWYRSQLSAADLCHSGRQSH